MNTDIIPHISLGNSSKQLSLPLKKARLDATIIENSCQMELTYEYINNTASSVEPNFRIFIDSGWSISSFIIQLENQARQSQVIDPKPTEETEDQQESNEDDSYEIPSKNASLDLLSVDVGSVMAGHTVILKCKLVGKLEKDKGIWNLRVPYIYFPKYDPKVDPHSEYAMYTQSTSYDFDFICKINSCHEIRPNLGDEKIYDIKLREDKRSLLVSIPLSNKFILTKDINIGFSLVEDNIPHLHAQRRADGATAFLFGITPSIKSIDAEARGEFIFLLDCCNTMRGDKMKNARSACMIFLQSLPTNCYFNVYTFGYHFEVFHVGSVKYSNETLSKALDFVARANEEMGKDEIYTVFDDINKVPPKTEYPRNIFLLMSEGIVHEGDTINIISSNNFSWRVHTIGYGDMSDKKFLKECAEAGRGDYQFVREEGNISECVVTMLENCLKPALVSCEFNLPKGTQIEAMTPLKMPFIYQGESFSIYGISKGFLEGDITFTAVWSHNLEKVSYKCVMPKVMDDGDYLFPLTIKLQLHNDLELDYIADAKLSTKYHIPRNYLQLTTVPINPMIDTAEEKKEATPTLLSGKCKIIYKSSLQIYRYTESDREYRAKTTPIERKMKTLSMLGSHFAAEECRRYEYINSTAAAKKACKPKKALVQQFKDSTGMVMAEMYDITMEESKEDSAIKAPLTALEVLLELQDCKGFWMVSEKFYKAVLTKSKMESLVIEDLKGLTGDIAKKVLATLVAIKSLNKQFMNEKSTFRLIEAKAMKFLKQHKVDFAKCEGKINLN